jgi:Flp pilus assembly protein TadG
VSAAKFIALAIILPILVLFAGISIDIAFAYVTKARLSKAVDAACLTGMKNLSQGQATATTLATNAFNANYGSSGLDRNPPTLTIGFGTNAAGNVVINVTATSAIRTFFMGYSPQWQTVNVGTTAQASRSKLLMSVVLDRSGSMHTDGGEAALPPAVVSFINYFDNTNDEVAMISFASNATVDVPINYQFITPITNAVGALPGHFAGATFGDGGLTLAQAQNDSVVIPPGQNVTKVVVYFTDGKVNTIQDTFNCTSRWGATLYNYGGYDPPSGDGYFDFFNPTDGTDYNSVLGINSGLDSNGYPPHSPTPDCAGITKVISQSSGLPTTFSRTNITADAQYRALQSANAMRAEGMIVYSIGLSADADQTFLKEIANDPSSPTYNANQPAGLAVFVTNCPSSTCTQDLQQVFQTIAAKILLRLTQ